VENANLKSRLQSKTIRAVIVAAVISVANAYIAVSGKQINVESLQFFTEAGLQVMAEGFTLAALYAAYKGRMAARDTILPWQEEKAVKRVKKLVKGK
jgi:hypothetical protein